jgi:MFS family permease
VVTTSGAVAERILTPQFVRLWIGGFAQFLSFFLLLPALPVYARTLGIPESRIGLLTGAFPLAAMLIRPVAGWAADRYGRRPFLLGGALVFAVSSALYAVSGTLPGLMLVRGLHGCGMGLYPTGGMAMAADLAPPARRGYVMGLVGIAANVALAIGPAAGLLVVDRWGFGWLFAVSTGMALVALVLALGQPETLAAPVRVPLALGSAFSQVALYPCAIVLCLMSTYGVQSTFLPLYAVTRGAHAGVFFTVMACAVILSRGIGGGLSDRVGRAPVAAVGTACVTAAMGFVTLGSGSWALVVSGVLYGLGLGAAQPALIAWCVDLASPTERGKVMGTFYTALELGIATGAIGAGFLVAQTGYTTLFLVSAGVALAASGLALGAIGRAAAPRIG